MIYLTFVCYLWSMWLTVCVTCYLSNLLFMWLAICVRLCDSLSVSIYYDLNIYPTCYLAETIVLTKSPVKDHSCPEGGQYRAVQSLALSCRVLFHQFILGCLTSPVLYQLNFVLPLHISFKFILYYFILFTQKFDWIHRYLKNCKDWKDLINKSLVSCNIERCCIWPLMFWWCVVGPLSPSITTPISPIELSIQEQHDLGYMPFRDDFERVSEGLVDFWGNV